MELRKETWREIRIGIGILILLFALFFLFNEGLPNFIKEREGNICYENQLKINDFCKEKGLISFWEFNEGTFNLTLNEYIDKVKRLYFNKIHLCRYYSKLNGKEINCVDEEKILTKEGVKGFIYN